MGSDDYTAAATGGSLKLKGVKDAGISKHKKKRKRPKPENETESETKADGKSAGEGNVAGVADISEERTMEVSGGEEKEGLEDEAPGRGKTEAERRHEEARRKRVRGQVCARGTGRHSLTLGQLDERLKREGLKTHKERVEELNRYLSNLSEHHDMYVHIALRLVRNAPVSGEERPPTILETENWTGSGTDSAWQQSKIANGLLLMRISLGLGSDQDSGLGRFMSGQPSGWQTIRFGFWAQLHLSSG